MRTRRMIIAACAVAAALAVAGCGEFKNTITPQPGTTIHIPLELSGAPSGLMAGVYDAIALGYYKQADMHVYIAVPGRGQDPLTLLHNKETEVAVSSEPDVLLTRERDIPVVSVGAIVQVPLASVQVKMRVKHRTTTCTGKAKKRVCKTRTKVRTVIDPSAQTGPWTGTVGTAGSRLNSNLTVPTDARTVLAGNNVPSYQGLVFVVRPASIVNNAPSIRLFLQTTARGYEAARKNPAQAIDNMIKLDPSLASKRATLLAQLKAYLPYMFPGIPTMGSAKGHSQPWGFMDAAEWTKFGNWLHKQGLIEDPAAVTDSNTNELLAGKGI